MRKLTLADCENVKISDLFLGLAIFQVRPEDAEAIEAQKNSPEEIEKANNMLDTVRKAVEEEVPDESKDDFMSILTGILEVLPVVVAQPMILLRLNDHYNSLNNSEDDPEDAIRIVHLEPLSDYYSEGEYQFVVEKGKVCLEVYSIEPFEQYAKKVTAEYALM